MAQAQKEVKKLSPVKSAFGDIFRGTMGGISLTFVGHPFDTVKVCLQTDTQKVFKGPLHCVQSIWRNEGIPGFYKGVASPLAGQMFFQAMKFAAYGQSLTFVRWMHDTHQLGAFGYFQAGFLAQAFGALIEAPVDFFKTQMQIQLNKIRENPNYKPEFAGVGDAARKIVHDNGIIRGPYQGFAVTLLRNVLAGGSYLASFEVMRIHRAEYYGCTVKELPVFETFMCGGFSGLFYWVPFFPIDVVKSSLMGDHHLRSHRKYHGAMDCVRKIYAEGGIKAFYKGFVPCVARSFPANAALLVTVFQLQNLGIPF